jgi:hypothetical protein
MDLWNHFQSLQVLGASVFTEDKLASYNWNHDSSFSDQNPDHLAEEVQMS